MNKNNCYKYNVLQFLVKKNRHARGSIDRCALDFDRGEMEVRDDEKKDGGGIWMIEHH